MTFTSAFRKRLLGTSAVASAALVLAACGGGEETGGTGDGGDAQAEAFYEGETVEIIVPYAAGGGTDLTARFLAPMLSEHVAGQPNVQVINQEGANTLIGSNEFGRTEPDGLTWFMSGAGVTFNYLLDHPDAQYSYADWTPIIGSPQGNVVYVSPETGIEEPSELPNSEVPLVLPVQSVEGSDLVRVVSLDLLGVDVEVVSGYDGGSAARVAFEQGEANINGDTMSTYLENVVPLVEQGEAVPMYTFGFPGPDGTVVRDPATPDIPHVGEVYEMIHGTAPEGEAWDAYKVLLNSYVLQKILWMHSDAPAEAIEAVKEGAQAIPDDPDYQEGADEVLGEGYEIILGEELETAVNEVSNPSPEAIQWVYDFLDSEYDIQLGG